MLVDKTVLYPAAKTVAEAKEKPGKSSRQAGGKRGLASFLLSLGCEPEPLVAESL